MSDLIDDSLAYSRLERRVLDTTVVDLREAVDAVRWRNGARRYSNAAPR